MRLDERLALVATSVDSTIDFSTDQAGAFQDSQMFRRAWERHFEGFGELADRGRLACELHQHLTARAVGEGVENLVEVIRGQGLIKASGLA